MPVNPDDLLIFKLREKTKQAEEQVEAGHETVGEPDAQRVQESQEHVPFPRAVKPSGNADEVNTLSYLSSMFFMASAISFGYLIYPQSLFLIDYAMKIGILAFIGSINYDYGVSIVNIAFTLLSAASGILMFANPGGSRRFSGIVSSLVILTVTFEYLNGGSGSLLVIVILAFFEIGMLAYASMTAASGAAEAEELKAEEMLWPRVETF